MQLEMNYCYPVELYASVKYMLPFLIEKTNEHVCKKSENVPKCYQLYVLIREHL